MGKEFEPDDPWQMVGVILPSPPGYDSVAEMTRCFIEEFALMGWDASRILRLFKNPFYAGAHMVYQQRGEEYVKGLITQVFGPTYDKEESHA